MKNVIVKFKNNESWTTNINHIVVFKQGCLVSSTLFGIYIDKLEKCLEEVGCIGTVLARIVIILLLYADGIVLLARCPSDIDKKLRILIYFFSNMGMTVNTNKTKIMIKKLRKT